MKTIPMFPLIYLMICLLAIPLAAVTMEKQPSLDLSPLLRVSIRVDHPVQHDHIAHYSLYRALSVSTFINVTQSPQSQECSYYITRTISNYPKEGLKVTYGGTQEKPARKNWRIKTGVKTYEMRDIQIIASEALSSAKASDLFKKYVNQYNLVDRPVDDWLRK